MTIKYTIKKCQCNDTSCEWEIVGGVDCVVCPCCGFTFSIEHPDGGSDRFSCPCCQHGEAIRGWKAGIQP